MRFMKVLHIPVACALCILLLRLGKVNELSVRMPIRRPEAAQPKFDICYPQYTQHALFATKLAFT